MKRIMLTASAAFATSFALLASVPEVTGVTMSQDDSRLVTITYSLANAPAVVTLDVQTNAGNNAWASIGGEALQNARGDVWKVVTNGSHTITWRPDLSWPDHKIDNGGARAVVTAWSLDNTPDYMVVDISDAGGAGTERYYPAADFLPGGLLGNDAYRTTKVVMRKIMANNVEWTMGTTLEKFRATNETMHSVTFSHNYYIGVFEVTQAQWLLVVGGDNFSSFSTVADWAKHPVDNVTYNEIRNTAVRTQKVDSVPAADTDSYWPAPPNADSFLGKLRKKTGIDTFDLPSEAQWEFAARAGHGSPYWGDGSDILDTTVDANFARLGRYQYNGGTTEGTAVVGSYEPNSWGIYDMHGNVWEWCLDWFEDDITKYNGAVNVSLSDSTKTLSPSGVTGTTRALRGGSWRENDARYCRPGFRNQYNPAKVYFSLGFRLVCTAGLQ